MASKRQPKVAIVHDWLYGGGAELVVEQLHKLFPEAPIYTSYCSKEWRKRLDNTVKTGILQYWPFSALRKFIPPLRIWWFTKLDLSGYDLVISSSGNGEAKGVNVPKGTLHVSYIHAPTHFYWRHYERYMERPGFGPLNPLARVGLKLLADPLRNWDFKAAQKPDYLIANSTHTQAEIKKFYERDSVVVHPPVYVERFSPSKAKKRKGFIIAGRQTPYKRFDIAVKACTDLDLHLTVVGDGPENQYLRKIAGKTITFLGRVADEELEEDLAAAEAFIFPTYEDFGIAPVEAMASGTPVIAYKAGGALDYVIPGRSGEFFNRQTVDSLKQVLKTFNASQYPAIAVRQQANKFSDKAFRKNMQTALLSILRQRAKS